MCILHSLVNKVRKDPTKIKNSKKDQSDLDSPHFFTQESYIITCIFHIPFTKVRKSWQDPTSSKFQETLVRFELSMSFYPGINCHTEILK